MISRLLVLLFLLAGALHAQPKFEPDPARLLVDLPPDRHGPVPVRVSWFLINVSAINGAAETFAGSIYVNLKWHDSRLAFDAARFGSNRVLYYDSGAEAELQNIWSPAVHITNLASEPTVTDVALTIKADGDVEYEARIMGEFASDMDLRNFPFDTQKLTVTIECFQWDESEVKLIPSSEKGHLKDVLTANDWKIRAHGEVMENTPARYSTGDTFSSLTAELYAEREPWFYMWSVVFPLILVTFFAVTCFYWDEQSMTERVAQTLTCLLTVTAQSFAVSGDLPRISYFTRIDYAFLLTYAILLVVAVESIIVRYLYERRPALTDRIDASCVWAVPLIYIIGMAVIFWQ